jgi:hypothetical protein
MDQKEFEDRLDGYAERLSKTVSDGVKKVEDAFDRGKENLRTDMETEGTRFRGSPRMGAVLVAAGLVWLLAVMLPGSGWLFPVIVIAAGVYLLIRNRYSAGGSHSTVRPERDASDRSDPGSSNR